MAERRMFSKSVVESARFLKMPASSQNLYFHLGMNADDDGVVEGYSVINLVKAHEDDLRVLYSKGFVRILNEDLVTYIADWREQNKIRPDRKKDSMYKNLLLQMEPDVELLEKKDRSDLVKKSGRSMDGEMSAQCSVVEVSLGQGSIGECSAASDKNTHTKYQLDTEVLTVADYESLIKQHSKAVVDGVIGRILSKPYHGCLNMAKISAWCAEQSVMAPAGKTITKNPDTRINSRDWPQKGLMTNMNETTYKCPECKDRGFIFYTGNDGYEYAKTCKCQELRKAKERLERSGLAREFKTKTFDNYDTCGNAQLTDAKNTAMRFTEELKNKDAENLPSMMLCGQVGAGKTHLGTASSVCLIDHGTAVIYMGYRDEMTALKSKILDESAYRKEIDRYKMAPVLFIDDFLKGKITESDVNIVYEIVNYRYNNNLPVIISTEKTLDDLINFDEAIASRLIEMCRGYIIVFSGKELNYRLYRGRVA